MQNVPETLYNEAKQIDKGVLPKPRMAILHLTYKCNQKCYYCFFSDWDNKPEMKEPTERIPEILQNLKDVGVQSVEFCGGGEPLVTPGIADIFTKAADLGFKMGLLTNGVMFKDKIAETFLKYGTYVRFSFETADPEIYKKVRGTDDCEMVYNNIKDAIELRKKLNSECDISIKIGLSKEIGEKQIAEVCYAFDGIKINNIQVKNLWNKNGTHYQKDINRAELIQLADGQTIPIVKNVVYPKFMSEQCWITPVQVAVDVFGDVYLCCYYMFRKNSHRIGNLFEKPLKELWGSEQHKEAIANIKISECLHHDCRFQKYMRIIRKMQKRGTWEFL